MRAIYIFSIVIAGLFSSPCFASPVTFDLFPRTTSPPSCKRLNPTAGKLPQPRSSSRLASRINTINDRDAVGVHWLVPGTQLSIVLHTLTTSTVGLGPIGIAIARTLIDAFNEVEEYLNLFGDGTIESTVRVGANAIDNNMAGLVYLSINGQRGSTLRVNVLQGQEITFWILSAAFRVVYNLMCDQGFGATVFSIYVSSQEIATGNLS